LLIQVTKWLKASDLPYLCRLRQEFILDGFQSEIKSAPGNELIGLEKEKVYAVFRSTSKQGA
jgi:hypothetical protein